MRPAAFAYRAPTGLEEVIDLLQAAAGRACVIAGGQSLVPEMAARVRTPELVVDLRRLGLATIERRSGLRVGATTTQAQLMRSPTVAEEAPLLARAASLIGYRATRARGTIGGSVAHGDPRAELPVALVTLDGTIELRGPEGTRTVSSARYFAAPRTARREPAEVIVAVDVPAHEWTGQAFVEQAPRHRGFAVCSAAVLLRTDRQGLVTRARASLGAVAEGPVAAARLGDSLVGWCVSDPLPPRALADITATAGELEPPSDFHATGAHRRDIASTLLDRALTMAARDAEAHLD